MIEGELIEMNETQLLNSQRRKHRLSDDELDRQDNPNAEGDYSVFSLDIIN
jgi:hypothetical protein